MVEGGFVLYFFKVFLGFRGEKGEFAVDVVVGVSRVVMGVRGGGTWVGCRGRLIGFGSLVGSLEDGVVGLELYSK